MGEKRKLTEREKEVIRLIAEGHVNRVIAEMLHISQKTVETHRANIVNKLNLSGGITAKLTRYAVEAGLV